MLKYCFAFLLLPAAFASKAQYRNLVFEGGGIRGIAYAGAVQTLEQKGILQNIEKVAGTSAGSIIGLMISLGYNAKEIDSIMMDLKIEQFNDGKGGLIGKYSRVKKFYGIHKGVAFEHWLQDLVNQKLGNPLATFADLHGSILTSRQTIGPVMKNFYCVGTNLTRQQGEIFSYATTPGMPLETAVRISCSIPYFYEPVLLDSAGKQIKTAVKGQSYQVYTDGGIVANYPINIFDSCKWGGNPLFCDSVLHNYQTLGLKLDRNEQITQLATSTQIPAYEINSLTDYTAAFINLVMETMNRKPNLENEKGRTIYIGYGNVFSKPRKMSVKEKRKLFESGHDAAEKFLSMPGDK